MRYDNINYMLIITTHTEMDREITVIYFVSVKKVATASNFFGLAVHKRQFLKHPEQSARLVSLLCNVFKFCISAKTRKMITYDFKTRN